ncbi:MAG: response regulator [Planctomycetota bacterium]
MSDREPQSQRSSLSNADALRDGQSLFLSLVHSIPACFLRKDREGRFVFVNERFAALFGKSAEEIVGKTVADFYPPEFAEEAREEDEQVMRSGEVVEDVFDDTVDGELRYFASRKGPVWNEAGEVIGIQTIFWDITEQRVAENTLLEEREELRRAKQAADDANRAKSDFLANMSHEIRTPMNAIIGMTDLLLETQLTQTQREYLRMVQDSGEALLTLINDILDFSKIEAGKLELERTSFDIRETLGDSMKGLGFRAHGKGLELVLHVDDRIPKRLYGDPGRIRQVVVNLVGNAIKFTEQGEIVLEIECLQQSEATVRLRFAVIDTGIGIAEDKCAKVFEEFEQADASTTRKFGGTGLGLAICARLVELMGGQIWVESELGRGSKFQFELPLEVDESAPAVLPARAHIDIHGVRVLIVDDNATNRRILKNMLTNWGMNPVTTSGGAHALRAIADANEEDDAFALVISDVNMPEMDGLMLAERIIAEALLKPASLIMLTSGARPSDATDLREMGVSQHLLKPIKQSEVYDAVISSLNATGMTATLPRVAAETATATAMPVELHILLAEDNIVNQKLALGILNKLGHRVTVAHHGKEALDRLDEQPFDLVLMDVQMPEMDGLAATRELRRREAHSGAHVPVVAMTAHAMKGDRERCLESGMDDYLSKPIRLKDLSSKLNELFSPSHVPVSAERPASLPDGGGPVAWSEALANVGHDPKLLRELVQVFLTETPSLLQETLAAADRQEADTLSSRAHALKGAMLFLNPSQAIASAEEVERLALEGQVEAAGLRAAELKVLFASLCDSLRNFLEEDAAAED